MIESATLPETIEHLDWETACQMQRCETDLKPASHVMTVDPPHGPHRRSYLVCTGCVQHFWAAMADRLVQCVDDPDPVYRWAEITSFAPLRGVA